MKTRLHCDNTRVTKWLYTRLWNLRQEGRFESTTDLIRQMSGFFTLTLTPYQISKLKLKIRQTRNTVDKRFKRHHRIREELSKKWRTDLRLISRWEQGGLINFEDHHGLKKLTILLNERDYVSMVGLNEIPVDMKTSLWG
jgi:hypothetical protein